MRLIKKHRQHQLLIFVGILIIPFFQNVDAGKAIASNISIEAVNIKLSALKVLQQKCNVCHQSQNPRKVFTIMNMSEMAPKIYKQVFVKKRMPKGNDNQLTEKEYSTLKQWIKSEKNI